MSDQQSALTTEQMELMNAVIEREKKARQEAETKQFLKNELEPDKFGPAKETAEYLKTNGLFDEIFQRSPELELLAVGPNRDANKLRDVMLKRGAELIDLKEKNAEIARTKAELEKGRGQSAAQPSDTPIRPAGSIPVEERKVLQATDTDFIQRLKDAGASERHIQLALLTGRDY